RGGGGWAAGGGWAWGGAPHRGPGKDPPARVWLPPGVGPKDGEREPRQVHRRLPACPATSGAARLGSIPAEVPTLINLGRRPAVTGRGSGASAQCGHDVTASTKEPGSWDLPEDGRTSRTSTPPPRLASSGPPSRRRR